MADLTEDKIRTRAFELWKEAGEPSEMMETFWYRAGESCCSSEATSRTKIRTCANTLWQAGAPKELAVGFQRIEKTGGAKVSFENVGSAVTRTNLRTCDRLRPVTVSATFKRIRMLILTWPRP